MRYAKDFITHNEHWLPSSPYIIHVTCVIAKFDVATSNGLEGDAFTRNVTQVVRTHGQGDGRTTLVLN